MSDRRNGRPRRVRPAIAAPLLDLHLVSNRVFAAATSQTFFGSAALFGGQTVAWSRALATVRHA